MKTILSIVLSIILSNMLYCQNINKQHTLTIEILPIAQLLAGANGAQISYNYQKNRIVHSFTGGFVFSNFSTGTELENFTSNGEPLAKWATEVDIETNRPYPLGGVVNQIDFTNLDSWGLKSYKPKMGFRLNRYVTYELSYNIINKKLNIYSGIGITSGLTNREESWVGFPGDIKNEVSGLSEKIWVNINIRAKYLYLGWTGKLVVDYPISNKVKIGLSGGFNYIFNKDWGADETLYYIGILGKLKI